MSFKLEDMKENYAILERLSQKALESGDEKEVERYEGLKKEQLKKIDKYLEKSTSKPVKVYFSKLDMKILNKKVLERNDSVSMLVLKIVRDYLNEDIEELF